MAYSAEDCGTGLDVRWSSGWQIVSIRWTHTDGHLH